MSTPPPPPAPARAPAKKGRTAPILIGSALALVGALLALVGGAGLVIFGSDGTLESGRETISTPTAAFVSGIATLSDTADATKILGSPTIRVSPGEGAFAGVGRASDVDPYLEGAPIARVRDFEVDPFKLKTTLRDGSSKPGPPGDETFWAARSTGGTMSWKVEDGSYRLVIMNADGSPRVTTDAAFELELPGMPAIAIVLLVAGLLLFGGGLALAIAGGRQ